MKQTTARIISLIIIILLFISLLLRPEPAFAGISEWSAEVIPSTTGNMLGPAGMDVRDFVIGSDDKTIYAVPGDSVISNVTYKSTDGGVSWAALANPARADFIAVAPDNTNIVAFANNSTPEVFLSIDGGISWSSIGIPDAGVPAAGVSDISISAQKNGTYYIAVAGWEAGNIANLWYYRYPSLIPGWNDTRTLPGFIAQNEMPAFVFSPNFAADATVVTVTGNIGTGANLQLLDLAVLSWNTSAAYIGYPCNIVTANITSILSASIATSPYYDGKDDDKRDLFIGLTIAGDSTAAAYSGIYRFRDTVKTDILTNKPVHSVDFNGSSLLAGMYNETTVYRILTPLASTWTQKTSTATKHPGGDGQVIVSWLGTNVVAGTGGNESAFSISKDSGATFTDISLIDTTIVNARDVAMPVNAGKVYLVTDDNTDTSVWYLTSGVWTRVFSLKSSINWIIRVERSAANVVYLAQKGTANIYYNGSSGAAPWQNRTCNINIRDIAVESTTTVYALDAAGKVSKSTNAGASWNTAVDTSLGSGNMLYSAGAGKLLAGSQNGYIAYSLDGNTTWQKISEQFDGGAGKMYVVPDQNFATNNVIYAATQTLGRNIMKWKIGTSTAWTDIFPGTITGNIYGLAVESNTLYALEYDPGADQSSLWRFITPLNATATAEGWTQITTSTATDADDANVRLNAEPQALKTSTGKLWAIKTNGTNKLYSFNDSVSDLTITLQEPVDNYRNPINSINGQVYDIAFSWKRPGVATDYEFRISMDPDFSDIVASINVTSTLPVVSLIIGPGQPGIRHIDLWPGMTYYWKIRTIKPGYSLFTAPRKFTIEATPVSFLTGVQLLAPAVGAVIKDTSPAFSWQPLQNTTEYEFRLSENIDMSAPLLDVRINNPGIQITGELEMGKTYFWQVRVTVPIESDWSPLGVFSVQEIIASPSPVIEATTVTTTIILPEQTKAMMIFPPADTETREIIPEYLIIAISVMVISIIAITGIIIKKPGERSHVYASKDAMHIRLRQKSEKLSKEKTLPQILLEAQKNKSVTTSPQPALANKEAASVIFAAKSLMWMEATEKDAAASLPEKEKEALGKKLAGKIRELAKKEPLLTRYPEDVKMLLQIWARYGSRKETGHYIEDSLKSQPGNALHLIKCFLPPMEISGENSSRTHVNRDCYRSLAQIVDPEKIYTALSKLSKFKINPADEGLKISPEESNIAAEFMRLHLESKKL